jgi:hypothetical protein
MAITARTIWQRLSPARLLQRQTVDDKPDLILLIIEDDPDEMVLMLLSRRATDMQWPGRRISPFLSELTSAAQINETDRIRLNAQLTLIRERYPDREAVAHEISVILDYLCGST